MKRILLTSISVLLMRRWQTAWKFSAQIDDCVNMDAVLLMFFLVVHRFHASLRKAECTMDVVIRSSSVRGCSVFLIPGQYSEYTEQFGA